MSKKKNTIFGVSLMIFFTIVVVALLPRGDICSDDIRGYKKKASASLNAARTKISSIKAAIDVEDTFEVPQLEGLSSTSFPALRACDTHCKLLDQCLRFVFFTPPSEACPTEYSDYKEATNSASQLLEKLHNLELSAEHVYKTTEQLVSVKKHIEEIENSSGSTGGRIAVLNAQAKSIESELSQTLLAISKEINSVKYDKKESKE